MNDRMTNYDYELSRFDMDPVRMLSIGFSQQEINCLQGLISNGYKVNTNTLNRLGLNYEQSSRIRYLFDICTGKVSVETKDELVRHLKKLNNSGYKIGIQDLAISKIRDVPRTAVVANVSVEPFDIWNSNKYKGTAALYLVRKVTAQRITIETSRKPKLQPRQKMEVPGMLQIEGVTKEGKAVVSFDKKFCRLCNRFVIVASLRRPEFHLGMVEMVCYEGTKVYVYAQSLGVRDKVKYNMGTQRIYAYGFFESQIKGKLMAVAKEMYDKLRGVYVENEHGNQEFHLVDPVRQDIDLDDMME